MGTVLPTATLLKGELSSIPSRPPEAQDQRLRNVNTEKLGRKGKRKKMYQRVDSSKEDEEASNHHKHRDGSVEGAAWKRKGRRDAGDCERGAERWGSSSGTEGDAGDGRGRTLVSCRERSRRRGSRRRTPPKDRALKKLTGLGPRALVERLVLHREALQETPKTWVGLSFWDWKSKGNPS